MQDLRRVFVNCASALFNARKLALQSDNRPTWLSDARVADVVAEALHHRDGKKYRLDAYSIMPNHVHSVFAPLAQNRIPASLSSIMHSLKRNTAKRANQIL